MKTKQKKIVLFSAVYMLCVLTTGCGSSSESVVKTDAVHADETLSKESSDTQLNENTETQEPLENTTGQWQVLAPDIAAAVDADFMGKVWKIEEDSFFIAEKKIKILDDGSLASSSPSSNADIPDSQLIHVIFDDNTYFYVRVIHGNGEEYEDKEAGFQDLKEQMSIDMKGRFEDDVFYATEIRLLDFS